MQWTSSTPDSLNPKKMVDDIHNIKCTPDYFYLEFIWTTNQAIQRNATQGHALLNFGTWPQSDWILAAKP